MMVKSNSSPPFPLRLLGCLLDYFQKTFCYLFLAYENLGGYLENYVNIDSLILPRFSLVIF